MDLAPPPPALFRLSAVPPDQVATVWPQVSGLLAPVFSRSECIERPDEVRRVCEAGEASLIVGNSPDGSPLAAGVVQVRDYRDGDRRAWVLVCGGRRFAPWPEVLDVIEGLSRTAGAKSVEFVGRPGWQRIARDYTAAPCETGTHYVKHLGRPN